MNPGRKRKSNVIRDPNGRSRGEREVVDPIRLQYRARDLARDGISPAHVRDQLAGFTLGRMRLIGVACERGEHQDYRAVSVEQYNAGESWARLCRRHSAVMGYSLGSPRSPSFVMVSNGDGGSSPEIDEDEALAIRRDWSDCYRALMDAGKAHGLGVKLATICWDVCVNSRDLATLSEADCGNLRLGLNAIGHVMGAGRKSNHPTK